jgi:hypothetical protein
VICGFGIASGEVSKTYTTARWIDGIPAELIEIGSLMAQEDYSIFGALPRGYDHVIVRDLSSHLSNILDEA